MASTKGKRQNERLYFWKRPRICLAHKATFGLSLLVQFRMLFSRAMWYFLNTAWPYLLVLFPSEVLVLVSAKIEVMDIGMSYSSPRIRTSINLNCAYMLYALFSPVNVWCSNY